jgi:hypothetical protein
MTVWALYTKIDLHNASSITEKIVLPVGLYITDVAL